MNFLALKGMSDGVTVLFTFVLGMLVVFLGMAIIIFFLAIIGKVFDKISGKQPKKSVEKPQKTIKPNPIQVQETDEVDEKTRVAIISAIYALLQQENKSQCEFIVRKITRR